MDLWASYLAAQVVATAMEAGAKGSGTPWWS